MVRCGPCKEGSGAVSGVSYRHGALRGDDVCHETYTDPTTHSYTRGMAPGRLHTPPSMLDPNATQRESAYTPPVHPSLSIHVILYIL